MTENTDDELWQEVVSGIKKIKTDIVVLKKKPPVKRQKEASVPFVSRTGFSDDLELADFHNVDASTAKKIRRNKFEVEGKLDLHGFTVDAAYERVRNFIFESYNQGKRCVMIITGKGYKQADDDIFSSKGVLREKVPEWLNGFDLRPLILSVSNPPEKLGGRGALYIILRRHRN